MNPQRISDLIEYLESIKASEGDIPVVEWGYLGWADVSDLPSYMPVVDCRSRMRDEPEVVYRGLMIRRDADPPRG